MTRARARVTAAVRRSSWLGPVLLVMLSGAVSQGFARFTYAFVLPQMRHDLLGSYGAAGALGAVNLGMYLVGVFAVTALSRYVDGTVLLKAGLLLTAGGLGLIAVAPSVPWVVAGMALAGSCSAAVWIPAAGVVAAHAPEHRRGLAFGLTVAGIGLGIAATGQLTAAVHRISGPGAWRPVWAVQAGVAFVIFVVTTLKLRRVPQAADAITPHVPLRELVPGHRWLLGSYFLYGAGYAIFTSFLVAALQTNLGMHEDAATRAYSLLGVASIFGGLLLGRTSDRIDRRWVLAAAMAAAGVLGLLVPVGIAELAVPAAIAYGLLMTGVGSVLFAYVSDVVPHAFVPAAFGTITLSLGTSQFVAPPFGGWLADRTGDFAATYCAATVVGILAGVLALRLPSARSTIAR